MGPKIGDYLVVLLQAQRFAALQRHDRGYAHVFYVPPTAPVQQDCDLPAFDAKSFRETEPTRTLRQRFAEPLLNIASSGPIPHGWHIEAPPQFLHHVRFTPNDEFFSGRYTMPAPSVRLEVGADGIQHPLNPRGVRPGSEVDDGQRRRPAQENRRLVYVEANSFRA